MGPELNSPKNITEYWHKKDILAFIKDPKSYRHNSHMPSLNLLDKEIDSIYDYLENRIVLQHTRNPEKYKCKSLNIIVFDSKHYNLNLLKNPKFKKIMKFINNKNIIEIKILESPENEIYYGEEGTCGVIYLYCNKKFGRKLIYLNKK